MNSTKSVPNVYFVRKMRYFYTIGAILSYMAWQWVAGVTRKGEG